jgi:uncharacterized phiE125 gp8 family phage protein
MASLCDLLGPPAGSSDLSSGSHLDVVTPPDGLLLEIEMVRDDHLRSANGDLEDDYIERLIRTAGVEAERFTKRAFLTQTFALVLDGFVNPIVLPRPPLQAVTSITYLDADGVTQTLQGSPSLYQVSAPVGPTSRRGRIRPIYGTVWPTTRVQMDAVRVEFVAGYGDGEDVPFPILEGMLLMIGEMYKQRSESVHTFQNPALLRARDLWKPYRVP